MSKEEAYTIQINEKQLFKDALAGDYKASIDNVTGAIDNLVHVRHQLYEQAWSEYSRLWHVVGDWECKKSPIGYCVYNYIDDRALDDCLFCHEPDERK